MTHFDPIPRSTILLVAAALVAVAACEDDSSEPATEQQQAEPPEPEPVQASPDDKAGPTSEGAGEATPAAIPEKAYGSYEVDPVHSMVVFRGDHFGFSYTYGMFNDVTGELELADDPSESEVRIEIAAASLFTGHKKRDEDLEGPDFLNASQFPKITFESSEVSKVSEGFEVKGDLTLHGETKPVTITMEHVGSGPMAMDNSYRTGFHGKITIDRTEFGVDYMSDNIAPEIQLIASIEGKKKK